MQVLSARRMASQAGTRAACSAPRAAANISIAAQRRLPGATGAAPTLPVGPGPALQRRSCRSCPRRRRAAPTVASGAPAAEEWLQATGVPLLQAMGRCSTLQDAAVVGMQAMTLTIVGSVLLRSLLRFLDTKVIHPSSVHGSSHGSPATDAGRLARTAWVLVSSLLHQAQRLLPLWSAAYAATAACALLQVALERRPDVLASLLPDAAAASSVLAAVRHTAQFLQDAAEEVVVLLVAFTLLEFKNRVVTRVQSWMMQQHDRTNDDAMGLVSAAGAVASAVIWGGFILTTLANYGVNLRPLLASLGASSLVCGLAAQSMLRNVAAGITLYATRPFSLGDHVVLWSVGGMVVVEGVVAALHPTRTVIARNVDTPSGFPGTNGNVSSPAGTRALPGSTFYINNGDIVESMIVENKSREPPSPLGGGGALAAESLLALNSPMPNGTAMA